MPKCQGCHQIFPIAELRKKKIVFGGGSKDVLMCSECRGEEPPQQQEVEHDYSDEAEVVSLRTGGSSSARNHLVDVKGDDEGFTISINSDLVQVQITVAWSTLKAAMHQKLRELTT